MLITDLDPGLDTFKCHQPWFPATAAAGGQGASLHQAALVPCLSLQHYIYDEIMVLSLMKHLTMTMYKPSPAGAAC